MSWFKPLLRMWKPPRDDFWERHRKVEDAYLRYLAEGEMKTWQDRMDEGYAARNKKEPQE